MNPALPRSIVKLPYAAARLPFTLLEDFVVARYWDQNAPARVGFERWLGSLDLFAGRLLADDEISRRGQALMRPSGYLAHKGRPVKAAVVSRRGADRVIICGRGLAGRGTSASSCWEGPWAAAGVLWAAAGVVSPAVTYAVTSQN